jgi:hypothetical protein
MAVIVAPPPMLRIPLRKAADMLGMHFETLRKMAVEDGEFTVLRNSGGPRQGRRVFFVPEEIEAFAQGQLEGLREYRARHKRRRR